MKNRIRNFFGWLAGADDSLLADSSPEVRMRFAALGSVFLFGYFILVFAWCKVGFSYYGAVGVIMPGLLVPTAFISLDRLLAMSPRKLTGQLAVYNVDVAKRPKFDFFLRCFVALSLTCVTTFTCMMDQSRDMIHNASIRKAQTANQPLLIEMKQQVSAQAEAALAPLINRHRSLNLEVGALTEEVNRLREVVRVAEEQALMAADTAAKESGGLDGLIQGEGPRHKAYVKLASNNAEEARKKKVLLDATLVQKSQAKLELNQVMEKIGMIETKRAEALANINVKVKADPRYVEPRLGLFAEATLFVALYRDPELHDGLVLYSIMFGAFLLCAELLPLLAIGLSPPNYYHLAQMAQERELAETLVVETEGRLAQLRKENQNISFESLDTEEAQGDGGETPNVETEVDEGQSVMSEADSMTEVHKVHVLPAKRSGGR